VESRSIKTLAARDAYRLWAPSYDVENPVTVLSRSATDRLTPNLAGLALLDVGCGRETPLPHGNPRGPRLVVGVDLVFEMLVADRSGTGRRLAAVGDMRALPLTAGAFDVAWCRLAIGHAPDPVSVYQEIARVVRPGAPVMVTDFHPEAVRAGHLRGFPREDGTFQAVEHYVHDPSQHAHAAAFSALKLDTQLDCRIGPDVKPFYERAGMDEQYAEHQGIAVVLALRFVR
jgi:malonyl-CoA O-methyltransferase